MTVAKSLDWETNAEHVFTVIARDSVKRQSEFKESTVQVCRSYEKENPSADKIKITT